MTKYYGMMIRDSRDDAWRFEFGSYDRSDVTYEIEDYVDHDYKRANMKLVVFPACPTQTEIDYFVREFNGQV